MSYRSRIASRTTTSAKPVKEGHGRLYRRIWAKFHQQASTAMVSYLGMALSLVSAPLLARELGAEGRGVLAAAFATVQLLAWLAFLGLPRGMSVEYARDDTSVSRNGIVWLSILGVSSCVVTWSCADILANGNPLVSGAIRITALVLPLTGLTQLGIEVLLAQGKLTKWNLIRCASLVLPSIVIIGAFAIGELSLEVAFLATFAGTSIATLAGAAACLPLVLRVARKKAPWSSSVNFWGASSFDNIAGRIDQILLVALTSPSSLGVYAVAVTCASASGVVTQAINHVSFSKFIVSDDSEKRGALASRAITGLYASTISGGLVIATVSVFGHQLFGPGFEDLTAVTACLVVFQIINDQWQLRLYADSASGTTRASALAPLIGVVVMIISVYLLQSNNLLTASTMAMSLIVFGLTRLGARHVCR